MLSLFTHVSLKIGRTLTSVRVLFLSLTFKLHSGFLEKQAIALLKADIRPLCKSRYYWPFSFENVVVKVRFYINAPDVRENNDALM